MKKYFLLMFLCTSAYSQTISEKWNSLYNRYDYTDNSGNLVGYKGYNSLTQSWEYTNLNTPDPRVAQYNEPQDPINLQLLDRALAANQARYDKQVVQKAEIQARYDEGYKKVKTVIDYYRGKIGSSTSNLSLRFENEVVAKINNAHYDYSRVDTEPIISWIRSTYKHILTTEIIKDLTPSKESTSDFKTMHGGYSISLIEEYVFTNKKWVLLKSEKNNGVVYYTGDSIYFKRGTNSWSFRELYYKSYDTALKSYIYTSSYGETAIDDRFTKIVFYDSTKIEDKRYIYTIGNLDRNIKL